MKRLILLMMLVLGFGSLVYADGTSSLMLTDVEIQKLKGHFPDENATDLVWKGDPLVVQLPIGKEKRIVFSDNVIFDVKSALTTDQLKVLNNDKSLYLTAVSSFTTTRVYVTLQSTGKVILIDLIPSDSANTATQRIIIKDSQNNTNNSSSTIETSVINNASDDVQDGPDVSYVDLVRFAWQQVYAPERFQSKVGSYSRAPMHTEEFVSDLVYGDKVIAHPEGSWVVGSYYVTAVTLQNKYAHKASIDLRHDICGWWLAATIYPRSILQPSGVKPSDTTTIFLVSKRPFGETLGVCHGDA
jgi:integrating conjugative element protein (TIGR03749 family)